MSWIVKAAFVIAGNGLALWLANAYVPGFVLNASWAQLAAIALILALLNFILKPVLTLILGPVIVLTLGLGVIIVNAIMVFALQYIFPITAVHLDILHGSINIQTIPALILATLVVSAVNFVIHLAL